MTQPGIPMPPELPPQDIGTGKNIKRAISVKDLMEAAFAPAEYFEDPVAAAGEVIFTAPQGYYSIITHYGCTQAIAVAGEVGLELHVIDVAAGIDVVVHGESYYSNTGVFAPLGRLCWPILLDEGQQLYRLSTVTPNAGAGGRVVYVRKTPDD